MLKAEADKVKPRRVLSDAAAVARIALGVEHREVDPAVVRTEACGPHNYARFHDDVVADGQASALLCQSPYADDTRLPQRALRDADERITAAHAATQPPA